MSGTIGGKLNSLMSCVTNRPWHVGPRYAAIGGRWFATIPHERPNQLSVPPIVGLVVEKRVSLDVASGVVLSQFEFRCAPHLVRGGDPNASWALPDLETEVLRCLAELFHEPYLAVELLDSQVDLIVVITRGLRQKQSADVLALAPVTEPTRHLHERV